MTQRSVHDLLDTVTDADALAGFLLALRDDLTAHPDQWQNGDVCACLEAMAAWVRDMERSNNAKGDSLGQLNPFQLCAILVYAMKIYE